MIDLEQTKGKLKTASTARLILAVEWALLILLTMYTGARTYPRAWQQLQTDFPNYYLTARLAREHYDTSRIYEWQWLQRQKDHRGIDQRLVGMVPITPFSTLMVWPIALMPPLQAKHVWLLCNLLFLFTSIGILQRITDLPWRRVAFLAMLSIPLRANFMLGQYYVLLLLVLSLSCLLYIRQRRILSGILIGFASALKVFPIIYLVFFLRKKDWKAFLGGVGGGLAALLMSLLVFGLDVHRVYLYQILPSILRGEGLAPYNLAAASLPSVLHSLFIFEPQLNPHPALNAPWLFALLHPLLQMLLVAPALLLIRPSDSSSNRIRIEWSAILLVSLTVSTSSSSYLFTLLILPVCLLSNHLYKQRAYKALWLVFALYLCVGFAHTPKSVPSGWHALFGAPRLYWMIFFCLLAFILLLLDRYSQKRDSSDRVWQIILVTVLVVSITSNMRHQRGIYATYRWRLPAQPLVYMANQTAAPSDSFAYISMMADGYRYTEDSKGIVELSPISNDDFLGIAAAHEGYWVERAGLESEILPTKQSAPLIHQAELPASSLDGQYVAFLREDHGRSDLWLRPLSSTSQNDSDKLLTPSNLNVLESGFTKDNNLVFSAKAIGPPALYTVDMTGKVKPLGIERARYPAASSDGRWLIYSQLGRGYWNLWLRDQSNGTTHKITDAECNDIDPVWTPDSKSIIYASDCGRGLWFTALCKRRVAP